MGIAAAVLWLLTALAADPDQTRPLLVIYGVLGTWFAVDLVTAIVYTLAPKQRATAAR